MNEDDKTIDFNNYFVFINYNKLSFAFVKYVKSAREVLNRFSKS